MADISEAAFSDGPSSPFVSEVKGQSRPSSRQHTASTETDSSDRTMDIFATPFKYPSEFSKARDADKENIQQWSTGKHAPATAPQSPVSAASPVKDVPRDTEMMPPPTMKKAAVTPKRSPLKRLQKSTRDSPSQSSPMSTRLAGNRYEEHDLAGHEQTNLDDTCFSAFSEAPEMTLHKFAQSPSKDAGRSRTPARLAEQTPRTSRKRSSPSRSPSPTPRRLKTPASCRGDGTTTFLIDFTQQFEDMSGYSHANASKSATQPDLLKYMNSQRSPAKTPRPNFAAATPSKPNHLLNLLDFELPPAPTPRSIPTITVRELESLKSSYLSQISSLKATLSGREAEVESFKRAIGDAERRAGEAQEAQREERSRRELAEEERAGWERRGCELENVLNNVKEEVLKSEAEKDELARKVAESERRAEEAEERAIKAEERFAEALASRAAIAEGDSGHAGMEEQVQKLVAAQIDSKIEAVSRELHAVYKEKHERKVATLKKSYEARGEKKCAELQTRLAELVKENEELVAAKDNTFSGPLPGANGQDAELKAQIEEHKAVIARLENERETSQAQQAQLMQELQQERIEKGDLVAAVDEMLALQVEQGPTQETLSVVEDFRKSISRPGVAGARPLTESRIGKSDLSRSTRLAPPGSKSRMLANIERMGRSTSGSGNGSVE